MRTSTSKLTCLICTVVGLALPQFAGAATRTIQFVGMLGADSSLHTTASDMMWGHCAVTIVNTGTQPQRIERIEMVPYIQGNQRTGGFVSADIQSMMSVPNAAMQMG